MTPPDFTTKNDKKMMQMLQRSLWNARRPNTVHDYLAYVFMNHEPAGLATLPDTLRKYMVGCTRSEAAILWYVDKDWKVVEGKVMDMTPSGEIIEHDPVTKRMGKPKPSGLCLYGEHLLNENDGTVFIVADEVTAMFFDCLMPDRLWLASPTDSLPDNADNTLSGRTVYLCNGGDIDTWRRYLRNSKVEVLDIIPNSMPDAKQSLRMKVERLNARMEEFERQYLPMLAKAVQSNSHEEFMRTNEAYRTLVERLSLTLV